MLKGDSFRKPNSVLEDRGGYEDPVGEQNLSAVSNVYSALPISYQRQKLPIFQSRDQIVYLLEKHQVVIVVGETASGKSTQLPQYLLESGWCQHGVVGITQPRRVAAIQLASRVADEIGCSLGGSVGYCVRFDGCFDKEKTKIKFLTDGMLMREILTDPLLRNYSVVMVDEAHERSQWTDIVLSLLRKIAKVRRDLRIIIASATIDAKKFQRFFGTQMEKEKNGDDTAAIITVEGRRMYPVEVFYSRQPVPNYLRASLVTIMQVNQEESETHGDILVFLPGQDEVNALIKMIDDEVRKDKQRKFNRLLPIPLYGGLPIRDQMKVFDSAAAGSRKVVVSTNIAETSLTIPGIVFVIDCGYLKMRVTNPATMIETLMPVPVSKASAEQRAGRAGRMRAGKCFRLYTESLFERLQLDSIPEIQRTSLASFVLQMNAMGIHNVASFRFPNKPPRESLIQAFDLLYAMKAIDEDGVLTNPLGIQMAECPLSPMHAKCLLSSADMGCSEEILTIVAMLQVQDVFTSPPGEKHKAERARFSFFAEEGDLLTYYNVFTAFTQNKCSNQFCSRYFLNYRGLCRVLQIRAQLSRILERFNIPLISCAGDGELIRKCLLLGFFANVAKAQYTGNYETLRGHQKLSVYQQSCVVFMEKLPQWVIYNEVNQDSMRDICVIQPEWLCELVPHYFQSGTSRELSVSTR